MLNGGHKSISIKALQRIFVMAIFGFAFGISRLLPIYDTSATTLPRIINYQAKITNNLGVTVPDGSLNVAFALYDAAIGGNCLWSSSDEDANSSTIDCGGNTPDGQIAVTVTNGVASVLLGDTTGGIQNTIPAISDAVTSLYLGVTIGADAEMTPRKRIVSSLFAEEAANSKLFDGFDSSQAGGTSAFVPVTDSNGNLILTGDPQGVGVNQGTLYVNPATAAANETILGVAVGGSSLFRVDAEGDVSIGGALTSGGNLDMANNLVLNIGAAGTDFTAGGGLTLASDLTVNNGASFNLGATDQVLIDASTTPHSANEAVFVDFTSAGGVAASLPASKIALTSGGMAATGILSNQLLTLTSNAGDASGSYLFGQNTITESSTSGAANIVGSGMIFDTVLGGLDITGSGQIYGYLPFITVAPSVATPGQNAYLFNGRLTNTTNPLDTMFGISLNMVANVGSPDVYGIYVANGGSVTGTAAINIDGTWASGIQMGANTITNIGSPDTDFTAGGGLTLASDLTVNNGASFNLGATDQVLIDAATTTHTTNDPFQINLTTVTAGLSGQSIDVVSGGIAPLAVNGLSGENISLTSNAADNSNLYLYGDYVATGSSAAGGANFTGHQVYFNSTGGGSDLTGTGSSIAYTGNITMAPTVATPGQNGILYAGTLTNTTNALTNMIGAYLNLVPNVGTPNVYGVYVTNTGSVTGSRGLDIVGNWNTGIIIEGSTTTGISINNATTELAFATTSPTVSISDTGTLNITDGTNTLMSLADSSTYGTLTVNTISPTTVNGFMAGGTINMNNNLITNIGDSGTDFTVGGGLTLASTLTANGQIDLGDNGDTVAINSSDWDISTTGVMTGIGAITADGLFTGTSGATISGATTSINANSNFATNINTGTSTGTVTIGGTAGNTINIGTDNTLADTIGIGSALDSLTIRGSTLTIGNAADANVSITDNNWSISTAGAASFASIGATSFSGNIDMQNNLITNIGVAGTDFTAGGGLTIGGTDVLSINPTISPGADTSGVLMSISGTFVEAGSGTHSNLSSLRLSPPTITDGAASVTNAAILYITNATAFSGANNYAILVDNGTAQFNGPLSSSGTISLGDGSKTAVINSSGWGIGATGDMTGIGAITADGLITFTFAENNEEIFINQTISGPTSDANALDISANYGGGATNGIYYDIINIRNFTPTKTGVGPDYIRGLTVGNIGDPGASITSTGINIGTGWDTEIAFTDDTSTISFGNSNTDTLSFTDGTNNMMTLTDSGTYGTLSVNTISPTTVNAFTAGGNIDMSNNLITNIGAAGTDFTAGGGLTVSGTTLLYIVPTTSPGIGTFGYNSYFGGAINEAGSGDHGVLTSLLVAAPTINAGGATVTSTASLYILNAPSATVTGGNYAFLVDAGDSIFDANIVVGGSTSRTETLSNAGFVISGDDLFVAGTVGVEGTIYTDSGLTVGASTTYADGSIDASGGTITMNNDLIENIGAAGTDFTAGGGLSLAGSFGVLSDVDMTFAGTENLAITSDLTNMVDILSIVVTPSNAAGTKNGIMIQQANSANGQPLNNGIKIDNADADLNIPTGLLFTTSGGAKINYAIDISSKSTLGIKIGDDTIDVVDYELALLDDASIIQFGNGLSGSTLAFADSNANSLITITDNGATADLTVTGILNATFATANSERLCWDGAGSSDITDCTGTPGDYAEYYGTSDSTIGPGDIVILDNTRAASEIIKDGEQGSKAWIVKSSEPYQSSVVGVVSTNPNEVIGENFDPEENPRPVALNGRVPVKVTNENGEINAGDYIATSGTPGYGMLATANGRVVGMALSDLEGERGVIIMQVLNGWFNGIEVVTVNNNATLADAASLINLDLANDLFMHGGTISGIGRLLSSSGSWSLDEAGALKVVSIETEKLKTEEMTVRVTDTRQMVGSATIPQGTSIFRVNNDLVEEGSRIFVTFRSKVSSSWWVSDVRAGWFEVSLDEPSTDGDLVFDYWIVKIEDTRTSPVFGEASQTPEVSVDAPQDSEPAPEDSESVFEELVSDNSGDIQVDDPDQNTEVEAPADALNDEIVSDPSPEEAAPAE